MMMLDVELRRRLEALAPSEAELYAIGAARDIVEEEVFETAGPSLSDAELAALVSPDAALFIVEQEISSPTVYKNELQWPIWPGGRSGVTIGIGYDLAHAGPDAIHALWTPALGPESAEALSRASGISGDAARELLNTDEALAAVVVPWDAAMVAYRSASLPEHTRRTVKAFPGAEAIHPHCVGALVSLVYNRGAGMKGERRREMREIRDLIADGALHDVPAQFRAMKEIWKDANLPGLLNRREGEAVLFEAGLAAMRAGDGAVALEGVGGAPVAVSEQALAYQVGLAYEASRAHQNPAQFESIGGAALDLGIGRALAGGRALMADIELRLRDAVCGAGFGMPDDLRRQVAAAAIDQAGATTEPLRVALTAVLGFFCGFLSESLRRRLVDFFLDEVVAPSVGKTLCEVWDRRLAIDPGAEMSIVDASTLGQIVRAPNAPALTLGIASEEPAPSADPEAAADAFLAGAHPATVSAVLRRLDATRRGAEPLAALDALTAAISAAPADPIAVETSLNATLEALRDPEPVVSPEAAMEVVRALIDTRRFEEASLIADRLLLREPTLLRHIGAEYAQALTDSGRIRAAIDVLERMHAEFSNDPSAADLLADVSGRLGRAEKQVYVDHVRSPLDARSQGGALADNLRRALAHYRESQGDRDAGTAHWVAVNRVALLARARRDRVKLDVSEGEETTIASEIVAALSTSVKAPNANNWEIASLAEAQLALGRYDEARDLYARFAADERTNAFRLASATRQLEEVWGLRSDQNGPGRILAEMKATLAARVKGVVAISSDDRRLLASTPAQTALDLETRTKDGVFLPMAALRLIVARSAAVCAIQHVVSGSGLTEGSGFLVYGPDLAPGLDGDKSYVLTNAHVIWDRSDGRDRSRLTPNNSRVVFDSGSADPRAEVFTIARVVWQSPRGELDAVLLELDRPVRDGVAAPLRLADIALRPTPGGADEDDKLAIIGHPSGGPKTLSVAGGLHEMKAALIDFGPKREGDGEFMHYETPTEPGNSGSPVFETVDWTVVGLHHAGFKLPAGLPKLGGKPGSNLANEGIWIGSIATQSARELNASRDWKKARSHASSPRRSGVAALGLVQSSAPAGDLIGEETEPEGFRPVFEGARRTLDATLESAGKPELWCPFALKGPAMRVRGAYEFGYPLGAIVHYTAGRFENGDAHAKQTMSGGKSKYSYFCISATGAIYQPNALDKWGSHAGRSWYPGLGRYVSASLVGIEICGAGLLSEHNGRHFPWWNKSHRAKNAIPTDRVRTVGKVANVTQAGAYHAYTAEQERSLKRLLIWLHLNAPERFKIEYILGHDEVAVDVFPTAGAKPKLGRKQDPGGSLSITMPELRAEIARLARDGADPLRGDLVG